MKRKIFISIGIASVVLIGATIVLYPAVHFLMQEEIVPIDQSLTLILGGAATAGLFLAIVP